MSLNVAKEEQRDWDTMSFKIGEWEVLGKGPREDNRGPLKIYPLTRVACAEDGSYELTVDESRSTYTYRFIHAADPNVFMVREIMNSEPNSCWLIWAVQGDNYWTGDW